MATVESLVSGDWFDIRERIRKVEDIQTLLWNEGKPDSSVRSSIATHLLEAVEGGTAEYKRRYFRKLRDLLDEAAFTSDIFQMLPRLITEIDQILLVTVMQRGILAGEIRLVPEEEESTTSQPHIQDAQIKSIIADVQEIVANDPSARMNSAIKNILLQLHKYRDEVENFKSLKEKADADRLEAITKNFQASFSSIFSSIRKNYGRFLEEQRLSNRRERGDTLSRLDSAVLQKLLVQQLEEMSRVRSTLRFVHQEHYNMREPLVKLSKTLKTFEDLFTSEQSLAEDISGGESAGTALLKMLAREIARLISE